MLGGELGWRQVREPAARLAQVRRTLAKRAGAEGDRVAGVRTMLSHVRKYAATAFPELTPAERDDACFPMSPPLAHEIVHSVHVVKEFREMAGLGGRRRRGRMPWRA